jgi:hypothetical protein
MLEIAKRLESMFSAPYGTYPKGGIVSSLRLTLVKSHTELTITTSKNTVLKLKEEKGSYIVWDGEIATEYDTLNEAVLELLIPIIEEEIKDRFEGTD